MTSDAINKLNIRKILLFAIFILFLQIVIGSIIYISFCSWETRAQFGDMFGFVNALFSGFAFAAVILALYLQQIEIVEQQKQISLQNKISSIQSFESTLFNLLNLHGQITASLRTNNFRGNEIVGRTAIRFISQRLEEHLRVETLLDKNYGDILDLISIEYKRVCLSTSADIGHYFRNLYHIIKFIHDYPGDIIDKKRYTSIVRAQLSREEFYLLFYNCLCDIGREKFKVLIETYSLLENMDEEQVPERIRKLYNSLAFGTKK